mmetsp:Transcript_67875/g.123874  ORF Transcript_67875/g.123874 Transcript_67875/m.123874 type:complete len:380 (+) Transcript_67875:41-1180(+)
MRTISLLLARLAFSGSGDVVPHEELLNSQKMQQRRPDVQVAAADPLKLLAVTLLSLKRLAAGWQVTASGRKVVPKRGGSILMIPPNVHRPYTKEDDSYLWEHKDDPPKELAESLGRGVKSVTARLERLANPTSEGHTRLFGAWKPQDNLTKLPPLRPIGDCIQRIIHDPCLQASDYRIGYKDRFRKALKEIPFDKEFQNAQIKTGETMMIRAMPEHRIEYLKYKKRVVWHKVLRRDDVFGSRGGMRMKDVVASYDAWAEERRLLLQRGSARALRALGGNETHLEWLKKNLKRVNTGEMELEAFEQLVLTNDYFGHDGNAEGYGDEDPGPDQEIKPVPAVVQLIETLPDENAVLREELVQRLCERINFNMKYQASDYAAR